MTLWRLYAIFAKCQFYEILYSGISARAGLPSSKFWPMVHNGSCITNMQRSRKSLSYLERYGQRNRCNFRGKWKSWQNAKFLELSAPDPFPATTSIPMNFDHTISKCYYVQLESLLAFHIIKIWRRLMCQFSCIFNGILGPKWENPGGALCGGHFEFLTKSKVYLRYWC